MWMAGRYSASWGLELLAWLSESPAAGRAPAGPKYWIQITVWAMELPESVRQNLLAEFKKSLRHLAVVVAGLELVEEVFDHVGGVAGELVNP